MYLLQSTEIYTFSTTTLGFMPKIDNVIIKGK